MFSYNVLFVKERYIWSFFFRRIRVFRVDLERSIIFFLWFCLDESLERSCFEDGSREVSVVVEGDFVVSEWELLKGLVVLGF